jgi:tetratricopeptide (TPR) repeat protein
MGSDVGPAPVDIQMLWEWHRWAQEAADRGETETAVGVAGRLLDAAAPHAPSICPWTLVNTAIDIAVNAGRYRFALEAAARWTTAAQELGRQSFPGEWACGRINLAEAQLCRGDAGAAAALLDEAQPAAASNELAMSGLLLMRAWLLAETGAAGAARQVAAKADPRDLGHRYRSEYHYTLSLIARHLGQGELAIKEARAGFAHAWRAASRRNGFFALGSAALAQGEIDRAIAALEAFAQHPYQGQSGPGLLLLASAYEKAGRAAEARQSYQWAIERDPESAAAATARERLAVRG